MGLLDILTFFEDFEAALRKRFCVEVARADIELAGPDRSQFALIDFNKIKCCQATNTAPALLYHLTLLQGNN